MIAAFFCLDHRYEKRDIRAPDHTNKSLAGWESIVTSAPLTFENIAELRRITEAIEQLRDAMIHTVELRSDCRQMRLALNDGRTLLVSVLLDGAGRPRLDIDVLLAPENTAPQGQLEVHFDGQS